jgi:hypothetical protein
MILDELKELIKIKYSHITILNDTNVKSMDRIYFSCEKHGVSNSRYDHFMRNGCTMCNKEKRLLNNYLKFVDKANIIHNYKYNYDKTKYINNKTLILITCNKHGDFIQRPDNHLSGSGCTYCNYKLSNIDFINRCYEIHGNKYRYDKTIYKNSNSYITIICEKHGEFKQLARIHLSGYGCQKCSYSIGENKISKLLNEHNVVFKQQYTFDNCKNKIKLRFDFYLPFFNTCIEYNGLQHYSPIEYFGGQEAFENQLKIDLIKKNYCKNNKIKLIVISYKEDIIKILKINGLL